MLPGISITWIAPAPSWQAWGRVARSKTNALSIYSPLNTIIKWFLEDHQKMLCSNQDDGEKKVFWTTAVLQFLNLASLGYWVAVLSGLSNIHTTFNFPSQDPKPVMYHFIHTHPHMDPNIIFSHINTYLPWFFDSEVQVHLKTSKGPHYAVL